MITRRRMSAFIRTVKTRYTLGTETFFGLPAKDRKSLLVADVTLNPGDIIQAVGALEMLWLILESTPLDNHEKYTLGRVEYQATLTRFSAEGVKDSFGRATTAEPTVIYSGMPLYRHTADRSADDNAVDRSAQLSSYEFTTPASYQLQVNDRLTIGSLTYTITGLLLAPSGLISFSCSSTTT